MNSQQVIGSTLLWWFRRLCLYTFASGYIVFGSCCFYLNCSYNFKLYVPVETIDNHCIDTPMEYFEAWESNEKEIQVIELFWNVKRRALSNPLSWPWVGLCLYGILRCSSSNTCVLIWTHYVRSCPQPCTLGLLGAKVRSLQLHWRSIKSAFFCFSFSLPSSSFQHFFYIRKLTPIRIRTLRVMEVVTVNI